MTDTKTVRIPLNKRGTEVLQISERESEKGGLFIDVRKFYLSVQEGTGEIEYLPTKKGTSLSPEAWAMVIDEISKNGQVCSLISSAAKERLIG